MCFGSRFAQAACLTVVMHPIRFFKAGRSRVGACRAPEGQQEGVSSSHPDYLGEIPPPDPLGRGFESSQKWKRISAIGPTPD